MNRVHAVCTHLQEIMNKVHFLPSSVKDKDEAIAWCAVSTSLLLPHTPMTDTLLPAQVQSPGCAGLLTLARGESGNACAIVQESQANCGGWHTQRVTAATADGVSSCGLLGDIRIRKEGWTERGEDGIRGAESARACAFALFVPLPIVCLFFSILFVALCRGCPCVLRCCAPHHVGRKARTSYLLLRLRAGYARGFFLSSRLHGSADGTREKRYARKAIRFIR